MNENSPTESLWKLPLNITEYMQFRDVSLLIFVHLTTAGISVIGIVDAVCKESVAMWIAGRSAPIPIYGNLRVW
jgi:hypothetical protein